MLYQIIKILKNGGIGIMPTDTIYGLVGSALSKKAVARIYKVRKRELHKPFIVLIASLADLKKFGVKLAPRHHEFLKKVWPGPASVILPVSGKKFYYLHHGTKTLAFRLPKDKRLRKSLAKTGPLVAPSANIAGYPPAKNIKEAKKYFGNKIDFYFSQGIKKGLPSTLVEIKR